MTLNKLPLLEAALPMVGWKVLFEVIALGWAWPKLPAFYGWLVHVV